MKLDQHLKSLPYDDLILLGYRGSCAHGTYVPPDEPESTDDIDLMGVAVGSISDYLGTTQSLGKKGTIEVAEEQWDTVVYELRKYIGLLCKANPNVLSLLWIPNRLLLHQTACGLILRENRDLFMTKRVHAAYTNYAKAQLLRLEKGAYRGYMGEKRKALVAEYGYDTKNASHCIRLLRMGIEAMQTGTLTVYREADAQMFIDIKKGLWTLDEVQAMAQSMFLLSDQALWKCTLPDEPDMDRVNNLCTGLIKTHLGLR